MHSIYSSPDKIPQKALNKKIKMFGNKIKNIKKEVMKNTL